VAGDEVSRRGICLYSFASFILQFGHSSYSAKYCALHTGQTFIFLSCPTPHGLQKSGDKQPFVSSLLQNWQQHLAIYFAPFFCL
jgi:hypothetical protein